MPDEGTLAFLDELARADSEVAATLAELDEIAADVEALRVDALELETFFVRLPAERARLEAKRVEVTQRLNEAERELSKAEQQPETAEEGANRERLAAAQRFVVSPQDAYGMASRGAREVRNEVESLESDAVAAARESDGLLGRAAQLAHELRERPRLASTAADPPLGGLEAVAEWAASARAALFVARGSLAAERDALVRQASELGALVLGESVVAGGAAGVARRVRRSD